MAVYKLKEFAKLCGISAAALSVAKSRGHVIVTGGKKTTDQRVDSDDAKNAAFIERCKSRKTQKEEDKPAAPGADPEENQPKAEEKPAKNGELLQAELNKKRIDLERAEQDRDLKTMQIAKMRGELIPTPLVKAAFQHLFTSFTTSFKQSLDNLMIEVTQTAHLNRNQQAELKGKLTRILNAGIDKGVNDAKTTVENLVTEFRDDQ